MQAAGNLVRVSRCDFVVFWCVVRSPTAAVDKKEGEGQGSGVGDQ